MDSKQQKLVKFKYNHINPAFAKAVDKAFPKLDILKYYPYGPEVRWSYWLCGQVNLTRVYLEKRNRSKTNRELVLSIIEETARAMSYLMTHGNDHWYDRQRIEAFALWKLFHHGDAGWSKKNLKGLTLEEKTKLFWKHQNSVHIKDKNERDRWFKHCLKTYGVYEIRQRPLIQASNTTNHSKILYTHQELCAIDLMVTCAFENLC